MKRLLAAMLLFSSFYASLAHAGPYETRVRSCLILRNSSKQEIGCVKRGQSMQVLKYKANGYSKVKVNGRIGYVYTRYIRPKAEKKSPAVAAKPPAKTQPVKVTAAPPSAPPAETTATPAKAEEATVVTPAPIASASPTETATEVKPTIPEVVASQLPAPEEIRTFEPALDEVKASDAPEEQAEIKPEATPNLQPTAAPPPNAEATGAPPPIRVAAVDDRSSATRPFKVGDSGLCDFAGDSLMEKNCKQVLQKAAAGEIPRPALEYALKTFRHASGKFCGGKTINEQFRNRCSFFFTDLDQKWKGFDFRSPAFLIDLCAGDARRSDNASPVRATYTNRGTGSARKGYADISGAKTTLAGVFMTGGLTAFVPMAKSQSKYKQLVGLNLKDRACYQRSSDGDIVGVKGTQGNGFLKGRCEVIRLDVRRLGEDATITDNSKPIHTSGFQSSSGCPSINQKDNDIARHLASHGNSLYIAYTSKNSEKKHLEAPYKGDYCKKDPDIPFGLASSGGFATDIDSTR